MNGLPAAGNVGDYVEHLAEAGSTAEIGARLQAVLQHLGFERFAYVHVRPPLGKKLRSFVPPGSRSGNEVHEFLATLPDAWVDYYLARDYGDLDPTLQVALGRLMPFTWREIDGRNDLSNGQRKVLNEARDHGITNGATIPIHGPDGGLSTLSVVSNVSEHAFEEAFQEGYRDLMWLAVNTHEAFLALAADAGEGERVRLSDVDSAWQDRLGSWPDLEDFRGNGAVPPEERNPQAGRLLQAPRGGQGHRARLHRALTVCVVVSGAYQVSLFSVKSDR